MLLLGCMLAPLMAMAQKTSQPLRQSSSPWRYPYTYRGNKNTAIAAPIEISIDYSYLRANQGPGQCGCFSVNGGSTEVAFHAYRWFSVVADLIGERSSSVNGGSQGLSLVSITGGPRLTVPIFHRYALFAQALGGRVHGFDTYFPVPSGSTGAANSISILAGGGLDIRINSWFAIRPGQADYFLSEFPNGSDNRQNNLRLAAGIVFRIW